MTFNSYTNWDKVKRDRQGRFRRKGPNSQHWIHDRVDWSLELDDLCAQCNQLWEEYNRLYPDGIDYGKAETTDP